ATGSGALADGPEAGSGAPVETAADSAGGAGVTGGTGSGRSTGVEPPLSFGVSILSDSDLASTGGVAPSGLLPSSLAASLFGLSSVASPFEGSSVLAESVLAESVLGSSSPPGLPRLLSLRIAPDLRPSGPRSIAACAGACPSEGFVASGTSAGRASRLPLPPRG